MQAINANSSVLVGLDMVAGLINRRITLTNLALRDVLACL